MVDNSTTDFPESPNVPNSEFVAEYKFVISFEAYRDDRPVSEGLERELGYEIEKALAKDFASEVEFLFGGLVHVIVGPLERGSILGSVLLLLETTVTAVDFFSKYKDFYESLVLLKNQLRAILSRILNRALPPNIYRTVNITFVPGPAMRAVPVVQKASQSTGGSPWYSRAFFTYLIVTNIFLTIIVFALVYRAVAAMYFGTP